MLVGGHRGYGLRSCLKTSFALLCFDNDNDDGDGGDDDGDDDGGGSDNNSDNKVVF